ncbi:hypothetical protein WKS98_08785 [Lagierella sp. ICN-221743]
MKKLKKLFLLLFLCIGLAACKNQNNVESNINGSEEHMHDHDHEHDPEHEHDHDHEHEHEHDVTGKEIETEIGKRTILKSLDEMDKTISSGPFNFKINAVQLSSLEVKDEHLDEFNGQKMIYFLNVSIFVEHMSNEVHSLDMKNAKIVDSNNKEYLPDMTKSDNFDGDFNGNSMDEGNLTFFVDESVTKDENLKLVIPQALDENGNKIGDEALFNIEFEK